MKETTARHSRRNENAFSAIASRHFTRGKGKLSKRFNFSLPSRSIGMAVGAIPFGEIARYAEMTGQIDFWGFVFLVQSLDAEYVLIASEKSK